MLYNIFRSIYNLEFRVILHAYVFMAVHTYAHTNTYVCVVCVDRDWKSVYLKEWESVEHKHSWCER